MCCLTASASNNVLDLFAKCLKKLVRANPGLFEHSTERANFNFAMIRNNAAHRATP